MAIDRFDNEYFFLSNFYESPMAVPTLDQAWSVEHAYQAMKARWKEDGRKILAADTPAQAKKLGKQVILRDDWEIVKVPIMFDLLCVKFAFDTKLSTRLMATGGAQLVEGNYWKDTFWGVCNGEGQNWLGRLLMLRRNMLQNEGLDILAQVS